MHVTSLSYIELQPRNLSLIKQCCYICNMSKNTNKRKLTPKQLLFCQEYLIDSNATQAAIRAGYSKKTAQQTGSENITKPVIADYIAELKENRQIKTEIDAEDLLKQLQAMRISDYADIINPDTGAFKVITDWPLVWRQMIDGLEIKELFERDGDGNNQHIGNLHKIKFVSRTAIMKMFGDHVNIKAFQQKEVHQHLHLHESVDRLSAGRDRARLNEKDVTPSTPEITQEPHIDDASAPIDGESRLLESKQRVNNA